MGEARRRKEAAAHSVGVRDVLTGDRHQVRDGGDPLAVRAALLAMDNAALDGRKIKDQRVPCNGCTACCYHSGVDVHPSSERPENLSHLKLEYRNDGWFLRKREDGACVHLGPDGCSVYDHRPMSCRSYDCRVPALFNVIDSYDGGHKAPLWKFHPTSEDGRVFWATSQIMGMVEYLKRHQRGEDCSANAIATAVILDEKFGGAAEAVRTLMRLPPAELMAMTGLDKVTPEQMAQQMRRLFGDGSMMTVVESAP